MRAAAKWSAHLDAWHRGGLSMAAYAREAGLKAVTLSYWKRRLAQTQSTKLEVVEVRAMPSPSRAAFRLEVNNVRIEVRSDFEADALRRLLGVLGAS